MSSTQSLANLTTIGVGGVPAEIIECQTADALIEQARAVWKTGEDWLILGGGSNLLIADEVPDLHVIRACNLGIDRTPVEGGELWRVQSGENWDAFVAATVQAGLAGVEALSGIPGSVGAAPIQNIGAYGQEVASTIQRVQFLDYETDRLLELSVDELELAYRDSAFKQGRLGVITWVEFKLTSFDGKCAPIESTQVAGALNAKLGDQVELSVVRETVLALRASKGMVFDAGDADTHGCGSFFTNPIVSDVFARTLPAEAPRWETPEDDGLTVKLSAAWLIEQSGISKGYSLPGSKAAVSNKHALAITNRGGATADEVLELASLIQVNVQNRFGIFLLPEPNLVGFESFGD
jgi:UDP-N-acetylmuramate dehydrogenase